MATFYWNSGKNEDIVTQWVDHLQHEAYVKDVNQIIEKNCQEISDAIKTGSAEQVQAINNVCGQLEDINFHLQSIDSNITELRGEINNLASMIDWKMSQMIEEQRITNQLLGHIAQLLRIPDSQKQRVYHIEQGIKYLKNAFMENDVNSLFYDDAFEELKKAEQIEKKDFITLNKIGQVHLYSKKHLNFQTAEEYFLKSARESFAEYNAQGTTTSNNLNPLGQSYSDMEIIKLIDSGSKLAAVKLCANQKGWSLEQSKNYVDSLISDQNNGSLPINNFLISTVDSYLLAARCSYLRQNNSKAIEYSEKACNLIPKFLNAKFDKAKYLAANNESIESVNLLQQVISSDRYFSVKTVKDGDLISKTETTDLLERLKINSYNQAKERLEELTKRATKNSKANEIISEIKSHLSRDNYLSNMKAIDLLDSKYNLPYFENSNMGYTQNFKIIRRTTKPELSLSNFLTKENNSNREFSNLKEKLKKDLVREEVMSFSKMIGMLGVVVGFFRGCTLRNFSMEGSTWIGTTIVFVLIGALIGYIKGSSATIKVEHK